MTESEKVVELEQKIVGVEMKTKDVIKEIKNLKKIQHDQGNELVGLDASDGEYPEKIKQLMEEVRWNKDKNIELEEKLNVEERNVKRQKEHLLNMEETKKELELKYKRQVMKLVIIDALIYQGVVGEQMGDLFNIKDIDQVQLLNKLMQLEEELQEKEKVTLTIPHPYT